MESPSAENNGIMAADTKAVFACKCVLGWGWA